MPYRVQRAVWWNSNAYLRNSDDEWLVSRRSGSRAIHAPAEVALLLDRRFAVVRWGQPRATQDVDFCLLTGFGGEQEYVDRLLARFAGRIENAKDFALQNRVILARTADGVFLDIALAAIPFEEKVIDRSSEFTFAEGISLTTASAEDLLVLKAFAARDRDWVDVRGIITRQGDRLDWNYILTELAILSELKEDSDSLGRLETIRQEINSGAKKQ